MAGPFVSEIVVAGDELVPELALPGAAHDGAQVERTDLAEGRRGREQRRFGVQPEDDRPGPVLLSLRRRQGDQTVPVHGQHGGLTRSFRLNAYNRAFTVEGFSPQVSVVQEERTSNAQLHDYKRIYGELRFVRLF